MSVWDRPELQTRPGLEPYGFDTIRTMLMRKMMESQANPYGMDPNWQGGWENEFMPQGHRGGFDPYGGGRQKPFYGGPGGGGWQKPDESGGRMGGGMGQGRGMGMRGRPGMMGGRMGPREMGPRGGGFAQNDRGMGMRMPPGRGGFGGGRPMLPPSMGRGQRGGGAGMMLPLGPGMEQGGPEDEFVGSDGVLPYPSPWPNQPSVAYDGPTVPGNPGGGLSGNTGQGGMGQPGWLPQSFSEWFGHKDPALFNPSWMGGGGGTPPAPSAPSQPQPSNPLPPAPGGPGAPSMPAPNPNRPTPTDTASGGVMPWDPVGQYSPRGGGKRPVTQTVGGGRTGADPTPSQPSTTGGPRRKERGGYGGYDGTVVSYDGQDIASWLRNYLLQYQKKQSNPGPGRRKTGQTSAVNRYKKGGDISGELNPNAAKLLEQLRRSYLNPGGGWMGNDTVGGGQVFGGFFRGDSRFNPNRSPSGLEGVNPNVGHVGFMRGDAPEMTMGGSEAFRRLHENLLDPVGVRIGHGMTPEELEGQGWDIRGRGLEQGRERPGGGMEEFFRGGGGGMREAMGLAF